MKSVYFIVVLFFTVVSLIAQNSPVTLPPWQPGMLDIHHINTGRGNCTFCILPDGTTLLIDAGDMSELHHRTVSARNCPKVFDHSATTAQWIVGYILSVYPEAKGIGINYALITHYHDDHFGEADSSKKISPNGYQLTGITEVGTLLPIKKLIDRGFDEPIDLTSASFRLKYINDDYHIVQTLDEYKKFIGYQSAHNNLQHIKFIPGALNQFSLLNKPSSYPGFSIRNVFGFGKIWYGSGDSCYNALPENVYPGENPLSLGIKISYGKFDYYAGGDIPGMDGIGQQDFYSMEAQAAPIVGQVDIATLNHHGNRDSQSPIWVRTLRPRVWVQQVWSSDHPGEEVLKRLTSKALYPGNRDIYATCMCDANRDVIGPAIDNAYISTKGNIVVRVYPSGTTYSVFVTNYNSNGNRVVLERKYEAR